MKKILALVAISAFMAGCGHSVGMVGVGTGWRAGGGEYGISYGEGLFGTFITKDGVTFHAELDSTQGFSYDPSSGTYKGIRSISYEVAPQINGYAVDFAKENPDVAKAYYDALVKYYETKKAIATSPDAKPAISDEKSKQASSDTASVISKAIDKAKALVKDYLGTDEYEKEENKFVCENGNCTYSDLGNNSNLSYQLNAAMTLLKYDGYSKKFEDTDEYYVTALEHFVTQLVGYQAKGNKTTPLRIKRVTVKDGVIEDLMFVYHEDDGTVFDVTCPSCVAM